MLQVARCITLTVLILAIELSGPFPAFALQAHGYKGLYVHQGAHLFFLLAMLSFTYRIHSFDLIDRKEWRCISHGALLLALWNLWAFTGHFVELHVPQNHIQLINDDLVPVLAIASWKEMAFFFLKMDHLLSVPAIFCFYKGLKSLLKESRT
jgi:hypothetical protein